MTFRQTRTGAFRFVYTYTRAEALPASDAVADVPAPRTAADVASAFRMLQRRGRLETDVETFVVFTLDTRNRITGCKAVHVGTLDGCPVDQRAIWRFAIAANASAIIIVHNHPSGDPTPSAPDRLVTERTQRAADILGIRMLDSIIVAGDRYCSIAEDGAVAKPIPGIAEADA
jgi:DNA repair protein RadC